MRLGYPEAFDELHERYRRWLWRLAWRLAGEREAALRTYQGAFLRLLREMPRLRLHERLAVVLYRFVREQSGQSRQGEPEAAPSAAPGSLRNALCRLPSDQREILLMSAVDEMTPEEINVILGIPLRDVRTSLRAALGGIGTIG